MLEKAVTIAYQAHQQESVKKQQKVVRAEESQSNINAVLLYGKTVKPVGHKSLHKTNPFTGQMFVTDVENTHMLVDSSARSRLVKSAKNMVSKLVCQTKILRVVSAEDSLFVGVIEQTQSLIIPTVSMQELSNGQSLFHLTNYITSWIPN